jgi:hypothetical protein
LYPVFPNYEETRSVHLYTSMALIDIVLHVPNISILEPEPSDHPSPLPIAASVCHSVHRIYLG